MNVIYDIDINLDACTGCGLCEAFCPVEVFDMVDGMPKAPRAEACWGCETCVGQCPEGAITITPREGAEEGAEQCAAAGDAVHGGTTGVQSGQKAPALSQEERELYNGWAQTMKDVLGLRWHPVAISLIPANEPLPDVPVPNERMRYCQSLIAARRGRSIMLPANRHACPDGTSILGLTEMPAKLASGELYILFHKLDNVEAAKRMTGERPHLEPRTVRATVVAPLDDAKCTPQVVAVFANPEQVMWLLMASSYYTGHRHDLHASGYNAQCVETTLIPYTSGEINVSFGCYGCRASSDVSDDIMFVGIPVSLMPEVIRGLKELGKKAIPQSRDKIYLPVA
ncbi:MAG: DUF169 domain-containing protein [Coriobacteriales bacterium]|jgi:uncharacterized protein (DUF169 family)/NAD-dependent dihydropyrimidine dehydrogenase PreA subunit|nr:DUF169 domain-containing protein [Coriobacteriales bacterium]